MANVSIAAASPLHFAAERAPAQLDGDRLSS